MLCAMSHVLLALLLWPAAVDAVDPAPAVAGEPGHDVAPALAPDATPAAGLDVGALSGAVAELLAHGRDAVRVALPPVVDDDPARAAVLERALLRALLDRRREDVVSPAFLRAKLQEGEDARLRGLTPAQLRPFACDHVLLARVEVGEGRALLRLELLFSETGEVLSTSMVPLVVTGAPATGSSARGVRDAVAALVDDIAFAIENTGQELRFHRTAITPLRSDEEARAGRLDRYLESELVTALKRRGFLVVERAQLAAALEQQALGQLLDEQSAPRVGQALGAHSLVVGSVVATGAVFSVSLRVLSTESGAVLGTGSAQLPRAGVVDLTAVETRTPLEAALRSAVAPGWGQAYNQDDGKAVLFALAGYGGLLASAGLGVAGVVAHAHYNDVAFFAKLPAGERAAAASDAKAVADALYLSALIAGGATATVWSLGVVDAIVDSPP